jgi:PKHD-type hydroxylase
LTDVMGVANSKFFGFNLATLNFVEGIQYTLYEGKGSHYGWHIDCLPAPHNPRKLSVSLLLSNEKDYKGGELEVIGFERRAIQIPQGQGVIFPSYIAHRVKPLESGKRVSLVAWLIGNDFV